MHVVFYTICALIMVYLTQMSHIQRCRTMALHCGKSTANKSSWKS
ncbi:unnamed protein product [Acanthoscelides obtectus]|uniref:Uncharacterized protein n=1 Tax=Acanthoscelides obtectus TaxID=200917 RepID=A0A9P0K520_ACAOB|nr:unnamed protein product [Acanthoscelides obtectus]CAK1658667.1 hypothetical protein AOBTE_LOCUS21058 [Acanthoscelides obtectus]